MHFDCLLSFLHCINIIEKILKLIDWSEEIPKLSPSVSIELKIKSWVRPQIKYENKAYAHAARYARWDFFHNTKISKSHNSIRTNRMNLKIERRLPLHSLITMCKFHKNLLTRIQVIAFHRRTDRRTDGWTDRRTDGRTDGQTDGQSLL